MEDYKRIAAFLLSDPSHDQIALPLQTSALDLRTTMCARQELSTLSLASLFRKHLEKGG